MSHSGQYKLGVTTNMTLHPCGRKKPLLSLRLVGFRK